MQSPQRTKIYILGLKNNFRGVNLFESIKKENLDVEVIWGVDYRLHKFSKDQFPDVKEEIFYGRQVSFGELACNLGHAMIMQKAFEEDIDLAVILEDDVHILNFLEFKTVIANLDILNPALVSLYFNGRNILSLSKKKRIISEKFYLKRNYCLSASTAAYAINKTALRKINPFLGSRKHISFQPDFPPYMGGLLTFFLLENSFINLAEDSLSVVNDRKNLFRKDGMAKRRVLVYSGVFFITYAHKLMNIKGYLMFFHGRKLSRMLKPQKRN